jgi:hypothetical protein
MAPQYLIVGECSWRGDKGDNTNQPCELLACNNTQDNGVSYGCATFNAGSGFVSTEDGTPCGTTKQCLTGICTQSSIV